MKKQMIVRRVIATVAVAGVMFASTVGAALASAPAAPDDKVTICHRTGSATNPFVYITVSKNAIPAHEQHGDFYGDPGCTLPAPPPPDPEPGPFVPCVVSAGVTQTETTVTGTPGADTIDCSMASPGKTILGFDGDDTITGTAFSDNIDSGAGNDTVTSLAGNDTVNSGAGNDTVTTNEGNDTVNAGDGNDTVTGGDGDDVIEGGNGNDTLTGSGGNDVVTDTGDGSDTITP